MHRQTHQFIYIFAICLVLRKLKKKQNEKKEEKKNEKSY